MTVSFHAPAAEPAGGALFAKGDGTDTLWNVEQLAFCTATDATTKKCTTDEVIPVSSFPITTPVTANVTPTSLAFGAVPVTPTPTASATQSISIANTGTGILNVTGATVTGPNADQFTATSNCTLVNGPVTCTVDVVFTPTSTGPKTAEVDINTSASGVTKVVTLTGNGIVPPPPAAPLNVTALALNASALVTWSEPSGSSVVSFDVTAFNKGNQVTSVTVPGVDRQAILTGLPNGTALTFKVRANNQGGNADSAPSAPVTPTAPAVTAPDAPSIGTATAAVGGASVSWNAPFSNGGSAITSYKVEVLDSSDAVIKTVNVDAPATSALVSGLQPGAVVRFRVTAVNSAGASVSSSTSNAVTVMGDLVAPTVSAQSPADAASNVPTSTLVSASFSEPVQGVSGSTFTLRNTATGASVDATVTLNPGGTSATLKPNGSLAGSTQYTATLTGGSGSIRDTAGNGLSTMTWSFKTAADKTAPAVKSRRPGPGAQHVSAHAHVVVVFSESVKGVSAHTFRLTSLAHGKKVAATVTLSADGRTATLKPIGKLAKGHAFRVDLTKAVHDLAGNRMASLSWRFHT